MNNKRHQHRLSIPDINIRVRKRGRALHSWAEDCSTLDISQNGLAFGSRTLELEPLQKVDIELNIENRNILGEAVICHAQSTSEGKRYGVLFIQTTPEVEDILSGHLLSTNEVRDLAEKMAEQFMWKKRASTQPTSQYQLMFDAVKALTIRLGEMGLTVQNELENSVAPLEALTFDQCSGSISFPEKSPSSSHIIRSTISVIKQKEGAKIIYQATDGTKFSNILELLDYLCIIFEGIETNTVSV